ncbi:MAG TPA: hypothetical protein VI749_00315 [Candidatus Omnitrophota bacterium]|nr:hypothetical protein [Candidatus Omnitrophota bacterium]
MHKRHQRLLVPISCLLVVSLVFCGCEPLRKKFTRKKKELKKEEFIPVLDPIDYPPSLISAREKYEYHYSMWQVWNKDLRQHLSENAMDKRKKYILSQIIQQLQDMKRWIPQEYAAKVDQMLADGEVVSKELDKPEVMRNQQLMESRLRRMESLGRNELNSALIFGEEKE